MPGAAALRGTGPAGACPISGETPQPGGIWASDGVLRDDGRADPATWPRPLPCPAATMRRMPPPPPPARWTSALTGAAIAAGLRELPRPAAPPGEGGRDRAASPSSTTARAPMPTAAARALASYPRLVWIAGGTAKEGGIEQPRAVLPACRRGAADRPRRAAAGGDAGRAWRAAPYRRHAGGGGAGRRRAPPSPAPRRWCCSRPPAPVGTSSPASTRAATGSATSSPRSPGGPPDGDFALG